MGNDDEQQPDIRPDIDASRMKNNNSEQETSEEKRPVETQDSNETQECRDAAVPAANLSQPSKRPSGFPWDHDENANLLTPNLLAPYLTGADADNVTAEQLINGVYVNIPRSRKLWKGDRIKLIWGYNTFYTTLEPNRRRNEPRLVQYLNSEQLANYQDGQVQVHYEVIRRSRLVGISERLTVNLQTGGRPRTGRRRRAVRRNRF
jgi:hypothetical protein